MTWLAALLLALAAFAIAAFAFRLARGLWTSLAAALAFGLAGYAVQASPDLPSAPKSAARAAPDDIIDPVAARREFVGEDRQSRAALMITADAMARRGRTVEASGLLAGITADDPQDFEAWLAQGIVLTDHADGALTAPALFAFQQAARIDPAHPGPGYFLGVSLIRQGRLVEARQVWAETLAAAPADATGRAALAERLARLDELLVRMGGAAPMPPAAGPPSQ